MSTVSPLPRRLPLVCAVDEFALTTVLLFIAVTVVRWLRDSGSPLYVADLHVALGAVGVLIGAVLTGLILTPRAGAAEGT
ncbi:hypothetical protein GCM10017744_002670 [Streptomyces antimycoticus]